MLLLAGYGVGGLGQFRIGYHRYLLDQVEHYRIGKFLGAVLVRPQGPFLDRNSICVMCAVVGALGVPRVFLGDISRMFQFARTDYVVPGNI